MTDNTQPEALIDLIDAYADTRHRRGIYNGKTEAARKAVIEALSGVQALSAAPAVPAVPAGACGYFSFSDECGFDRHDTADAAKAAATEMLADIRRELGGEEWPMNVESICWGVVVERAAEHETTTGEDGEKYCDYVLKGASPTPTAEQQAQPGAVGRTGCTAGTDEECTRRGCATSCPAQQAAPKAAPGEPPGIQALMCVISSLHSLRDTAHFSDEEGELTNDLCTLRDWAYAQTAAFQPSPKAAQAVVQDDLITLRKPTTSAELLWLLKLAHLVISDVDKTLEETFSPAQPAAEPSRFGSPELQAMIIARCVEKDQADSGFDHKTAADLLNNKIVSDEAVRKFVAASRWAHDERAALSATLLAMHGVLTSREAEIALLKRSLLDAEAAFQPAPTAAPMSSINRLIAYSAAGKLRELGFAWDEEAEAWLNSATPQPAPDCHHRPPCDECAALAAQGGK